MMNRKNIYKWSFGYGLFRKYVICLHHLYYDRITIVGKNNIPENKAVIFVMNHQNALMDALALLTNIKEQPVFLARSDIFKNQFVARILYFLKILPIYRIRDGYQALEQNKEIFQLNLKILRSKKAIGIMPEGNHGDKRRLRPFQKGVFRIAFLAQEENPDQEIFIQPVGLHFEKHNKAFKSLFIHFGKPILVKDFLNEYIQDANKGIKQIKSALSERLSNLIIDIRSLKYYHLIEGVRQLYAQHLMLKSGKNHYSLQDDIKVNKKIVKLLDHEVAANEENIQEMNRSFDEFKKLLKKLDLPMNVFDRSNYSKRIAVNCIFLFFTFPFFLAGFLLSILPVFIVRKTISRIKDEQFISSVRFVASLVFFSIYYLILFLILISFFSWYISFGIVMIIALSGLFAFEHYLRVLRNTYTTLKAWNYKRKGNSAFGKARHQRKNLIRDMEEIFKKNTTT